MAEEEKQELELEKELESVDSKIQTAIDEVQKQFKSEIAGLNRKNSELEKELETERKTKMTDLERVQFEKEAAEKRAAALEAQQEEYKVDQMIMAGLSAKEINVGVKSLMSRPATADELLNWINNFTTSVESEVERRVNERLKGKDPGTSEKKGPAKKLDSFADGQTATEAEFLEYLNSL